MSSEANVAKAGLEGVVAAQSSISDVNGQEGRLIYWGLNAALAAGLFAAQFKMLSVAFFSLVLLTGIFAELEELGLSFKVSAFFTLVINSLIWAGVFSSFSSSSTTWALKLAV